MSITTVSNLSVGNSLTVVGNTILGADATSTLIINSPQTFNNGCTINGAVTHASGVFYTSSENFYFNGNVFINNVKTLTTSTGKTTINSTLSEIYGDIYVLTNKKLWFANTSYTTYLKLYHSGSSGYIDFTGGLNMRVGGSITAILNTSNGTVTIGYSANFNGISNTGNISSTGTFSNTGASTFGSTVTIAGKTQINNKLQISNAYSLYISNSGKTEYMRLLNDSTYSIIDYTRTFLRRINRYSKIISINPTSYQLTINYNLNTKGITNTTNGIVNGSTLQNDDNIYIAAGKSLFVSDSTTIPTKCVRVHHDGNASAIIDYVGKLYIRSEPNNIWVMRINSDYQANFYYNLNTVGITNSSANPIINNGVLT